jgi:signal transduction histidine kinase
VQCTTSDLSFFFSKEHNYRIGASVAVFAATLVICILVVKAPYPDMVGANSYPPIIIFAATSLVGIRFGGLMTMLYLVLIVLSSQPELLNYKPQYTSVAKTIFYDRFILVILAYAMATLSELTMNAALVHIEEQNQTIRTNEKLASLGTLVGGIAHEINNPLSVINGNLLRVERICREQGLDETLAEPFCKMKRSIQRISNTVKSLLALHQPQLGQGVTGEFGLREALEESVDMVAEKRHRYGITIVNQCDPSIRLRCQPDYLVTVLRIVIDNALDALGQSKQETPTIWLETESDGGSVAVKVRDNGPGIGQNHRDQIFDPFFSTKEPGQSSGIGLFIVQNICQTFGWTIHFETSPQGTTFIIELGALARQGSPA